MPDHHDRLSTGAARPRRRALGLVGAGAFGAFAIPHLRPHFDLRVHDNHRDLRGLAARHGMEVADLDGIGASDVVVLAVPLAALGGVARRLAPRLRPGTLVLDVCSIKVRPVEILRAELPGTVDIVATHPLFGPQSGRHGIAGLKIAVCDGRGRRAGRVARFLERHLALDVVRTSPEAHDREMAHVQGLTHLVARALIAMELPALSLKTTSFGLLETLVEAVGQDSEALFRTILVDNPHAGRVARAFAETMRRLLERLDEPAALFGPQANDHVDA